MLITSGLGAACNKFRADLVRASEEDDAEEEEEDDDDDEDEEEDDEEEDEEANEVRVFSKEVRGLKEDEEDAGVAFRAEAGIKHKRMELSVK